MTKDELREEVETLLLVAADLSDIENDPMTAAITYTTTETTNPNVVKLAVVAAVSASMRLQDTDKRALLLEAADWVRKTI